MCRGSLSTPAVWEDPVLSNCSVNYNANTVLDDMTEVRREIRANSTLFPLFFLLVFDYE